MALNKLVYAGSEGTDKELTVNAPSSTAKSQYPSEWFTSPNKKPVATYRKGGLTGANIGRVVYGAHVAGTLNVDMAKCFIHQKCASFTGKLGDANWESYGTAIGAANGDVKVWDIISVQPKEDNCPNIIEDNKYAPKMDQWLLILLLSPARIRKSGVETYTDSLKEKVLAQMKLAGFDGGVYPSKQSYDSWPLDADYMKMVAAIDMFLTKFPNHEQGNLRICTLGSRFKDCAGLMSIGFLADVLNVDSEARVIEWLWTNRLAKEVIQMMNPDEELVKEDSYFPYQSDMQMVRKTYYSASVNPHLYFVLHAAGSLLGVERCQNARLLSDANIVNNCFNAKILAFAFASTIEVTKVFSKAGDKPREPQAGDEALDLFPDNTSANSWFEHFVGRNFKLPREVVDFVTSRKAMIVDPRSGSIGEYVKRYF